MYMYKNDTAVQICENSLLSGRQKVCFGQIQSAQIKRTSPTDFLFREVLGALDLYSKEPCCPRYLTIPNRQYTGPLEICCHGQNSQCFGFRSLVLLNPHSPHSSETVLRNWATISCTFPTDIDLGNGDNKGLFVFSSIEDIRPPL